MPIPKNRLPPPPHHPLWVLLPFLSGKLLANSLEQGTEYVASKSKKMNWLRFSCCHEMSLCVLTGGGGGGGGPLRVVGQFREKWHWITADLLCWIFWKNKQIEKPKWTVSQCPLAPVTVAGEMPTWPITQRTFRHSSPS